MLADDGFVLYSSVLLKPRKPCTSPATHSFFARFATGPNSLRSHTRTVSNSTQTLSIAETNGFLAHVEITTCVPRSWFIEHGNPARCTYVTCHCMALHPSGCIRCFQVATLPPNGWRKTSTPSSARDGAVTCRSAR